MGLSAEIIKISGFKSSMGYYAVTPFKFGGTSNRRHRGHNDAGKCDYQFKYGKLNDGKSAPYVSAGRWWSHLKGHFHR